MHASLRERPCLEVEYYGKEVPGTNGNRNKNSVHFVLSKTFLRND
jgi:hypothetical protein